MKILVAIKSKDYRHVGDRALRWCGRLGFDMRLFAEKKGKRRHYIETIWDANYNYYLALQEDVLVTRSTAEDYARKQGYDLLVTIPEELWSWRKGGQFRDNEIKLAYEAIASARGEFSRKPRKQIKRFANGAVMQRVV